MAYNSDQAADEAANKIVLHVQSLTGCNNKDILAIIQALVKTSIDRVAIDAYHDGAIDQIKKDMKWEKEKRWPERYLLFSR